MNKLALINIIQYCLGEEACGHILASISARAPGSRPFCNKGFANADWEESKHPRANDGKFTSGSGGGGRGSSDDEPEVSREEIDDDYARRMEGMSDLSTMRELETARKRSRGASARKPKAASGEKIAKIEQQLTKAKKQYETLLSVFEQTDDDDLAAKIEKEIDKVEATIGKLHKQKWDAEKRTKGKRGKGLSDILPSGTQKPAKGSWLERLETARDESDEEAIINVTDENGDVHEFTPEELDAEIKKQKNL